MSKLLFGKINLSKIDKTKLFKGEKGIYHFNSTLVRLKVYVRVKCDDSNYISIPHWYD